MAAMPSIPVGIMMNVGTPEQAFSFAQLPHHGVGLARLEFIINRQIGIHPKALLALDEPTRRRLLRTEYYLRRDLVPGGCALVADPDDLAASR